MTDEAKQAREALYVRILAEIAAAAAEFPGAELVPPEGFTALAGGISKGFRQPEIPGVLLREGKYGLNIDVSIAASAAEPLQNMGEQLQKEISDRLYTVFSIPVSAINIDILKLRE